ncbi:hypothetical protein JW960_08900, partial [candidate division KSB1 bacterium]|nr:hypothetical protein [candidate division KSB1 bacterium]
MKLRRFVKLSLLAGTITAGMLLNGCADKSSVAPTETAIQANTSSQNINFIAFGPSDSQSLEKVSYNWQYINKYWGGTLHIHHMFDNSNAEAVIDLKIKANTIDYSKWVGMTFDDQNQVGYTDIVFSPHGTQFSSPALLTIELKNVNLSGIDPNKVRLYYVDESGNWVEHPTHEIYVDATWGVIRVVDAQIPHFSRYA